MRGYRPALYGMVADLPPDIVRECNGFFKSYIRSCQDHKFLTDPVAIQTLIRRVKLLTGKSFYEFCLVNYENGHGKRAEIFRQISKYMRGEISGQALKTYFDVEQDLCVAMTENNIPYAGRAFEGIANEDVDKVKSGFSERTLYSILACVGPSNLCRFMLTFNGEYYDGRY